MNPDGKQAFPKTGKRIRKGSAKALFDWIWRKVPNLKQMLNSGHFRCQQVIYRLTLPNQAVSCTFHKYFRRTRTGIVVRAQRKTVSASIQDCREITRLQLGHGTIAGEKISRL